MDEFMIWVIGKAIKGGGGGIFLAELLLLS
jgi:hypothetical protein